MAQVCITKRVGKTGAVSWLIKYDTRDPFTNVRVQSYKTIRGTKKDAQSEMNRILSEINDGNYTFKTKLSLGQWLSKWLKDYAEPNVSTKTVERYQELLNHHVVPHLGMVPIQQLNPSQIQGLYTILRTEGRRPSGRPTNESASAVKVEREKRGLSEQTILHVHRVFNQALTEAVRSRTIKFNPARDVKAPSPKKVAQTELENESEKMHVLDRDQLGVMLKGARNHRLFHLIAAAAGTGLRRGELLALRWADLDFEKKTLRVERAVEDTKLKGIRFKAPKNKSSRRMIGIDETLCSLLNDLRKRQIEEGFKVGVRISDSSLIFSNSVLELNQPIRPKYVTSETPKIAASLGLKGITFHDLRHTHATLLLSDGVPVNAVAQRLGHSDPTMTLRVYGHVLKRSEDQAVSVSASLMSAALAD